MGPPTLLDLFRGVNLIPSGTIPRGHSVRRPMLGNHILPSRDVSLGSQNVLFRAAHHLDLAGRGEFRINQCGFSVGLSRPLRRTVHPLYRVVNLLQLSARLVGIVTKVSLIEHGP